MERHGPSSVTYHNNDSIDPMEIDREYSPMTVCGDSAPRLTPYSPEVIELDALNRTEAFNPGDYLTEEQFEERFLDSRHGDGRSPGAAPQPPGLVPINSYSVNGKTYRRGKTVELHNGDSIRIMNILEDRYTGAIFLQGFRLRRLSQYRRLFDQHINELLIVTEEECIDVQTIENGIVDQVSFSEVLRIRDTILTNAPFPSFGCREDPRISNKPREFLRDQGRLVCRWKLRISVRPHSKSRPWIEKSIIRMAATEADINSCLVDERLRRRWRGATLKMGSCASWFPGERDFDLKERNLHQTLGIPNSDRDGLGRQEKRYTFGDAFCGGGGCSRGAKSAGLRVVWGFDSDLASIDSYAKNFFGARCEATPADVFISILNEDFCVDILHLSPPCQPYSPAHTRPGQNDELNEATFFAVGEIIKKCKPRIVTLENTFGLAQRWPEWMDALIRIFTTLGFSVRWRVLNLAEYGLSQARRRLIVIAACPGEKLPGFPPPTHGPGLIPFTTVNDAIQRIPPGSPNHDPAGAARRNTIAYDGNVPLKNCIMTGGSLDTHPSGQRGFTNRELACLNGFPLEHVFGNVGVKRQIGNAVPPLFAEILFSHIRRWLEDVDR
ncbi:MAG: hypothetical protein Q9178_006532 [Gyalolechia marmorata]